MVLKQSGDKVGLYIDKELVAIFENKSVEQVTDWIESNLKGVKIHIAI